MAKKAAFITVHGMGRTDPDYHCDLVADLEERLGPLAEALHCGSVYYQGILQPNEDRVWDKLGRKVKSDELRRFWLFGFADAAGLESGKDVQDSDYWLAQQTVARELLAARTAIS